MSNFKSTDLQSFFVNIIENLEFQFNDRTKIPQKLIEGANFLK